MLHCISSFDFNFSFIFVFLRLFCHSTTRCTVPISAWNRPNHARNRCRYQILDMNSFASDEESSSTKLSAHCELTLTATMCESVSEHSGGGGGWRYTLRDELINSETPRAPLLTSGPFRPRHIRDALLIEIAGDGSRPIYKCAHTVCFALILFVYSLKLEHK